MNPAEKLRHYIGIDLLFYDEHNVFLWMERERKRERVSLNCFTLRLVTQLMITVFIHVPKIVTNEFIVHAFIIQLLNELQ